MAEPLSLALLIILILVTRSMTMHGSQTSRWGRACQSLGGNSGNTWRTFGFGRVRYAVAEPM